MYDNDDVQYYQCLQNGTTPVFVAVDRNSQELLGILKAFEANVNKAKVNSLH